MVRAVNNVNDPLLIAALVSSSRRNNKKNNNSNLDSNINSNNRTIQNRIPRNRRMNYNPSRRRLQKDEDEEEKQNDKKNDEEKEEKEEKQNEKKEDKEKEEKEDKQNDKENQEEQEEKEDKQNDKKNDENEKEMSDDEEEEQNTFYQINQVNAIDAEKEQELDTTTEKETNEDLENDETSNTDTDEIETTLDKVYIPTDIDNENIVVSMSEKEGETMEETDELSSSAAAAAADSLSSSPYYVPNLEGYLTLQFSIYVPENTDDAEEEMDSASVTSPDIEAKLESLVMLFLCSKEVELVSISTDPSQPLVPVCPFTAVTPTGNTNNNKNNNALEDENDDSQLIVWNLPKTTTRTVPLPAHDTSLESTGNTTESEDFYTVWTFTYPVYQWSSANMDWDTNAIVENTITTELQQEFNTKIIETGTLNSLLPFAADVNALAATVGQESLIFWHDQSAMTPGTNIGIGINTILTGSDDTSGSPPFDSQIPVEVCHVLMIVGGGLIVFNTLMVVVFTYVSQKYRKRYAAQLERRRFEREQLQKSRLRGGQSDHASAMSMEEGGMGRYAISAWGPYGKTLESEEGVSAFLFESKQYAIARSQAPHHPHEHRLVQRAKQQQQQQQQQQPEQATVPSTSAVGSSQSSYLGSGTHGNDPINLLGSCLSSRRYSQVDDEDRDEEDADHNVSLIPPSPTLSYQRGGGDGGPSHPHPGVGSRSDPPGNITS